jgi:hypothetical protein
MFTSQLASPKRANIFRRNVRRGRSFTRPPPTLPTRPATPPTHPDPADPARHPTLTRPARPAPHPPTAPGALRCSLRCSRRRSLLRYVDLLETAEMEQAMTPAMPATDA